jgi:hypothetical protein
MLNNNPFTTKLIENLNDEEKLKFQEEVEKRIKEITKEEGIVFDMKANFLILKK